MSPSASPQVYVESDHALPLVQMSISVRTGAAIDPPGREGLTRFMGRLMRRTGGGLDSNEIENRFEKAVETWPKFKAASERLDQVIKEKERRKSERPRDSRKDRVVAGSR